LANRGSMGVFLVIALAAGNARADDVGYMVGPSAGVALGPRKGPLFGLDLTLVPKTPFWISGGVRFEATADEHEWQPYAEVGVWFLFNAGIGVTATQAGADAHLFFGLPVPVWIKPFAVVEPYYRPCFGSPSSTHELGLLMKLGRLPETNAFGHFRW